MIGRNKTAAAETTKLFTVAPSTRDRAAEILGRLTMTGDRTADSLRLREEFHIQLIELADAFSDLDHEFGPDGGSDLEDDCLLVRELIRREMHPRFREAFRDRQREVLEAEILTGLVAGPHAK
jgi:hypothetical protein